MDVINSHIIKQGDSMKKAPLIVVRGCMRKGKICIAGRIVKKATKKKN